MTFCNSITSSLQTLWFLNILNFLDKNTGTLKQSLQANPSIQQTYLLQQVLSVCLHTYIYLSIYIQGCVELNMVFCTYLFWSGPFGYGGYSWSDINGEKDGYWDERLPRSRGQQRPRPSCWWNTLRKTTDSCRIDQLRWVWITRVRLQGRISSFCALLRTQDS